MTEENLNALFDQELVKNSIYERFTKLKEQQPNLRRKDAADALNVPEASLVDSQCGVSSIRLDNEGNKVVEALPSLGYIMNLTRNNGAVHERKGEYFDVKIQGPMGLVVTKDKKIDYLFALGEKSALAAKAFGHQENAFTDLDELLNQLTPMLNSQSIVLVKGSRSARMERVVTALQSTGEADARLAR